MEKLREKLANLGSVGKVLEKRQAVSMRIKVDDRTRLEEVQKILDEKEQDTAMAAEIGQTLLEKNVQLENEIGQLHTKLNEYQRLLMKLEEIQTEVRDPFPPSSPWLFPHQYTSLSSMTGDLSIITESTPTNAKLADGEPTHGSQQQQLKVMGSTGHQGGTTRGEECRNEGDHRCHAQTAR